MTGWLDVCLFHAGIVSKRLSIRCGLPHFAPREGSGVVRIDPLRFLAGCRTRRLNQV